MNRRRMGGENLCFRRFSESKVQCYYIVESSEISCVNCSISGYHKYTLLDMVGTGRALPVRFCFVFLLRYSQVSGQVVRNKYWFIYRLSSQDLPTLPNSSRHLTLNRLASRRFSTLNRELQHYLASRRRAGVIVSRLHPNISRVVYRDDEFTIHRSIRYDLSIVSRRIDVSRYVHTTWCIVGRCDTSWVWGRV